MIPQAKSSQVPDSTSNISRRETIGSGSRNKIENDKLNYKKN